MIQKIRRRKTKQTSSTVMKGEFSLTVNKFREKVNVDYSVYCSTVQLWDSFSWKYYSAAIVVTVE